MKFGKNGKDFSRVFWEAGRIAAWFGAWEIQDLYDSYSSFAPKKSYEVTKLEIATYLNGVLKERGLPSNVSALDAGTAQAFDELEAGTWVLAYFDRTIHLGRIANPNTTFDGPAEFDYRGELAKTKLVEGQKSFRLADLPEVYLMVASTGQSTLHRLPAYRALVNILIKSESARAVNKTIDDLSMREWLDLLGPKGWESICTAFLILTQDFVPTGLNTGGTLDAYDIVGRDSQGTRIFAQCKKSPSRHFLSDEEEAAFKAVYQAKRFYFAYNGIAGEELSGVTHLDGTAILRWLHDDPTGRKYAAALRAPIPAA